MSTTTANTTLNNGSADSAFHEAIDAQDIWKPGEMHSFAVALVAAAVLKLKGGHVRFSTDDVPEIDHPSSSGIAGSVVEKLKNASLIEACGHMHDGAWCADRIRSVRTSAKGRWIGTYKLCSLALGNAFLERNAVAVVRKQAELTLG